MELGRQPRHRTELGRLSFFLWLLCATLQWSGCIRALSDTPTTLPGVNWRPFELLLVFFGTAGCLVALSLAVRALHRSNDFSLWPFVTLFLGMDHLLLSVLALIGVSGK
jgi:hypothetical protein